MRAVCLAIVVLHLSPAFAEPIEAAREHYRLGNVSFDLGDYDRAIDEFKQAYALSNKPRLLFNLAQAYRLDKRYDEALHAYTRYLELEPGAPNRDDVEQFMASAQAALDEERRRAQEPPQDEGPPVATPEPVTVPPPVVTPPPPERCVHTRRGRVTLALIGAAGGLLAVSAIAGGTSLAARQEYDRGCDRGACDAATYDRGRQLAITTDVMLALGVATAVAALVVAVVHPRRAPPVTLGMVF